MNKVRHLGEKYEAAGILHDVVEDTSITISFLREAGIPEDILMALQYLNMREGDYMDNIMHLSTNDIATQVKLRDLEHNSKITRLKSIKESDHVRIAKYHEAYTILKPQRR